MTPMNADWEPADEETARIFARYKQAKRTERELKPSMRDRAVQEMKRGASLNQLADLTGEGIEALRRLREAHGIPVDPRYESRAELARARKKAVPPPAARPDAEEPQP